jgi:class 3 adenylate cyclase
VTDTTALEAAGERRHVTVIFCDLVDSTGIAARLDAEEWRDLVGAYLEAAFGCGRGNGRQSRQEARRRADGA